MPFSGSIAVVISSFCAFSAEAFFSFLAVFTFSTVEATAVLVFSAIPEAISETTCVVLFVRGFAFSKKSFDFRSCSILDALHSGAVFSCVHTNYT